VKLHKNLITVEGNVLKIEDIHVFPLGIPFKGAARIASWEYPFIESLLVKIRTDDNVVGYGEAVGSDIEIRLDANQGWKNYWTALKIIKRIERYDVSLIEQPLPAHDLRGSAMLKKAAGIPIMLDESIHGINDALAAIRLEACDIVSVKIMKAGGLLRIKELVDLCSAHGMPCHMGTSWETEVGWAAILHLIKALPGIRLWDAYPPTEIYWGATASIATPIKSLLEKGVRVVKVSEGPGLGVAVNDEAVTQHLVSKPVHLKKKI